MLLHRYKQVYSKNNMPMHLAQEEEFNVFIFCRSYFKCDKLAPVDSIVGINPDLHLSLSNLHRHEK